MPSVTWRAPSRPHLLKTPQCIHSTMVPNKPLPLDLWEPPTFQTKVAVDCVPSSHPLSHPPPNLSLFHLCWVFSPAAAWPLDSIFCRCPDEAVYTSLQETSWYGPDGEDRGAWLLLFSWEVCLSHPASVAGGLALDGSSDLQFFLTSHHHLGSYKSSV